MGNHTYHVRKTFICSREYVVSADSLDEALEEAQTEYELDSTIEG